MTPKMAPKKATKQSSITSMGFPLLQKSTEMCVGRQIQVPVSEYHPLHKWDAGGTPSQAMELWEMGVDGQDTEKPEDPLPIAFSL